MHPVWNLVLAKVLQISSMTSTDDVMIRSGFHYHTSSMFKCESTIDSYYDKLRARKKELTEDQAYEEAYNMVSIKNKCDHIDKNPIYEIDGYSFYTCVCNFIHPELDTYINYFNEHDKHGNWPFRGSIADQPAYIVEVINLLKSLSTERDIAEQKKQEKRK